MYFIEFLKDLLNSKSKEKEEAKKDKERGKEEERVLQNIINGNLKVD